MVLLASGGIGGDGISIGEGVRGGLAFFLFAITVAVVFLGVAWPMIFGSAPAVQRCKVSAPSAIPRVISCRECGEDNPGRALICSNCGKGLGYVRLCIDCGSRNNTLAHFCNRCSAPIRT